MDCKTAVTTLSTLMPDYVKLAAAHTGNIDTIYPDTYDVYGTTVDSNNLLYFLNE